MATKSDGAPDDNPKVRLYCALALAMLACMKELKAARRFVVARHQLRCGASIGADVHAAQHAAGRGDFVHKCRVAAKEAGEIDYWLRLCLHAPACPTPLFNMLLSVRQLLARIIISGKANAT